MQKNISIAHTFFSNATGFSSFCLSASDSSIIFNQEGHFYQTKEFARSLKPHLLGQCFFLHEQFSKVIIQCFDTIFHSTKKFLPRRLDSISHRPALEQHIEELDIMKRSNNIQQNAELTLIGTCAMQQGFKC